MLTFFIGVGVTLYTVIGILCAQVTGQTTIMAWTWVLLFWPIELIREMLHVRL